MTRPVDPYVVRRFADCIELLPKYVNSSAKMPFVQEVVQKALERMNADRETLARGFESFTQGDDRDGQQNSGKKYGLDRHDAEYYRKKAGDCRKPVTSVWLSDTDKEVLKAGFEDDETGIFEFFERTAAEIAEWLREHRHPRDAEIFRNRFSFVCGEALLYSQGVEVSPGVYKLDLGAWEAEAAKPLCDDLRQLANEMVVAVKGVSLRDAAEQVRPHDSDGQTELIKTWRNSRSPKLPVPLGKCPLHSQMNLYEPAAFLRFLQLVEGERADRDFGLSAHFRKVSRFPRRVN